MKRRSPGEAEGAARRGLAFPGSPGSRRPGDRLECLDELVDRGAVFGRDFERLDPDSTGNPAAEGAVRSLPGHFAGDAEDRALHQIEVDFHLLPHREERRGGDEDAELVVLPDVEVAFAEEVDLHLKRLDVSDALLSEHFIDDSADVYLRIRFRRDPQTWRRRSSAAGAP